MADDIAAATAFTCPWCSATLPAAHAETCPTCGAHLVPDTDAQVPGVTTIDAEAIVRAAHQPTPQRRNRFLSWISGEYDADAEEAAEPGSISPPDPDVRREMLRLELEAEVANLQAEAGMALADADADAEEEVGAEAPTSALSPEAGALAATDAAVPESPDAPSPDRA